MVVKTATNFDATSIYNISNTFTNVNNIAVRGVWDHKTMAGRKRRFTPPKGFTQCSKLRADYEENGVQLGRFYLWHEDKAIKAWGLLGGVLGGRWKLEVYRYHWVKDNPMDYRKWKKSREVAKDRAKRRGKL